MGSFLPNRDADLLAWATNASALITAAPATYGVPTAVATAFAAKVADYQTALAACEPGVRNKSAVASKNVARLALRHAAGYVSNLVHGTEAVTDAQKIELGLNVRAQPAPRPIPSEPPVLTVVGVSRNTVRVRLASLAAPSRRGLPPAIAGATLFSHVGATPPTTGAGWVYEGGVTRTLAEIVFDESLPMGTQVFLTAMWRNERDQNGPACTPVPVTLLGGAALPGTTDVATTEARDPMPRAA